MSGDVPPPSDEERLARELESLACSVETRTEKWAGGIADEVGPLLGWHYSPEGNAGYEWHDARDVPIGNPDLREMSEVLHHVVAPGVGWTVQHRPGEPYVALVGEHRAEAESFGLALLAAALHWCAAEVRAGRRPRGRR